MGNLVLEVVTPQRRILKEKVVSVVAPGTEGYLGVLPRHAPLLTTLKPGVFYYSKVEGKGTPGCFRRIHGSRPRQDHSSG